MEPLADHADQRLFIGCVYCGAANNLNDEHAPSRVLLDRPLPDYPAKIQACEECNRSYSLDEEYFSTIIGCALSGTTDPARQTISRVGRTLLHTPALRASIEASRVETSGGTSFVPVRSRIDRVVLKLARSHVAYESSVPQPTEPRLLQWKPLSTLSQAEQEAWEEPEFIGLIDEIGSRASQRQIVVQAMGVSSSGDHVPFAFLMNDWIEVQEGVYRYHVSVSERCVRARMVVREYLACEVVWDQEAIASV